MIYDTWYMVCYVVVWYDTINDMIWYNMIRYKIWYNIYDIWYDDIYFIIVSSRFEPIDKWTKTETAQYTKTNNNGQ